MHVMIIMMVIEDEAKWWWWWWWGCVPISKVMNGSGSLCGREENH